MSTLRPLLPLPPNLCIIRMDTASAPSLAKVTSTKFVWTAKKESCLIDLVRAHPALWNPADKNFTKKTIKKVLFTLIGQEMGEKWPENASSFTATFVHSKFNSLKSYFNKEDKRRVIFEGTGIDFVSKWVHYDHLCFLKSVAGVPDSSMDTAVDEESQPTYANLEGQPDAFENGLSLEAPFTIKEEPSTSDIESNPSLPINSEPSRDLSTNTPGEETLSLAPSSLPNIEESSSSDLESTPSMLISKKPPKKRIRKNPADEILSLATSALKNIKNGQDSDSSSVSHAIGFLVQTTLQNLSPELSREFTKEIFAVITNYTQYIDCSR